MRWRTGHDSLKVVFTNICNEAHVPNYCEVFGLFHDTILAELGGPGGKLQYAWERNGLFSNFKLGLST